jgi:hypothetical protein
MSEAIKTNISTGHKLAIYLLAFITIASAIYFASIYFPEPKGDVKSFQTPDILIPTPFEEININEDSSTDSGITILSQDATPSSESAISKQSKKF